MKPSEFEEKEYENPLCSQLEGQRGPLWSPGQVLENRLGFDRGLFLTADYLWALHGRNAPLAGVIPLYHYWRDMPQALQHRLPTFRLNCFIQVKRCFVGQRLRKRLSALGSERPFFRFDVDEKQQSVLERAAATLKNRALFIYASPVFGSSQRLFFLQQRGELVEHSTFPDVQSLSGHGAWYYNKPGAGGIPNPDYEFIEAPAFEERIAAFVSESGTADDSSVDPGLSAVASSIRIAVTETPENLASAQTAYVVEDWRYIDRYAERVDLTSEARSYLEVVAFAWRFDLRWFAVGELAK